MSNEERVHEVSRRLGAFASYELRGFLARLLGWTNDRAVDHAFRSIELAVAHLAHLVLCGVAISCRSHTRCIVACSAPIGRSSCAIRAARRRGERALTGNYGIGVAAFEAAVGGSLCVRSRRLPRDFSSVVARIRATADVQIIVCSDGRDDAHPFPHASGPDSDPIAHRSYARATADRRRVRRRCRRRAAARWGKLHRCRSSWVLQNAPLTLAEIEKATLRLVAIRTSRN